MSVKNMKTGEPVRLVVLGCPGVGKSALVVRFLTKRFIWEYDSTLDHIYRHQTTIDDEPAVMDILDTTGLLPGDQQCSEANVRWGDSFIIVYGINDRRSFEETVVIKRLLDDIRKPRNVSCVLVGNKCDLEHERRVSTEEGEKLATDCACAFFETSAYDGGAEITEVFHEVYREAKRRKMMEEKPRRRSSAQQVKQVFSKVLTKIQQTG